MSTETAECQILSFCCMLKLRYSFMGYATLPLLSLFNPSIFVLTIVNIFGKIILKRIYYAIY